MNKWLLWDKELGILDSCDCYSPIDADQHFASQGWQIGEVISKEDYLLMIENEVNKPIPTLFN